METGYEESRDEKIERGRLEASISALAGLLVAGPVTVSCAYSLADRQVCATATSVRQDARGRWLYHAVSYGPTNESSLLPALRALQGDVITHIQRRLNGKTLTHWFEARCHSVAELAYLLYSAVTTQLSDDEQSIAMHASKPHVGDRSPIMLVGKGDNKWEAVENLELQVREQLMGEMLFRWNKIKDAEARWAMVSKVNYPRVADTPSLKQQDSPFNLEHFTSCLGQMRHPVEPEKPVAPTETRTPTRVRWEYAYVVATEESLAARGKDGWELVNVDNRTAYFKRLKV